MSSFKDWFLERIVSSGRDKHQDEWWNVMCLTGVDYFSSLGFVPAMACLYAGYLSPFAMILLVALNLLGAYPMYAKVAELSPHGQGSVSMLQDLLPNWWGKLLVICLLGFATTGFMMTITLCSSDAAKHIVDNPLAPDWLQNQLGLTLILVALLGAVFIKGFKDAIWVAVILVWSYLLLTGVIIGAGLLQIFSNPIHLNTWFSNLNNSHATLDQIILVSLLTFPRLALGMSGFETGVAVMPHIKGDADDTEANPKGRVRKAKHLLLTAAVIMAVYLIGSSIATTLLIPMNEFAEAGKANGRALAYLAHEMLGHGFGTVYDISTCLVLWFAGASALAGLLNLIPRYLPRYGMAPEWTESIRPLVLFITFAAFAIVLFFDANVDKQAGAFATGLLVFMTSAAFAAMLATWRQKSRGRFYFPFVFIVFVYTTLNNIIARPEGIQIALAFILFIVVSSFVSRCMRSTELRIEKVSLDEKAASFLNELLTNHQGEIRLLAHRPGGIMYAKKEDEARRFHSIQPPEGDFIFLEVSPTDSSDFMEDNLIIRGEMVDNYRIWKCESPSVPNAIAGILLHVRDLTGKVPHVYFGWTEGHPVAYVVKYILWGEGETAPVTREILRSIEPDPAKRPRVHVS